MNPDPSLEDLGLDGPIAQKHPSLVVRCPVCEEDFECHQDDAECPVCNTKFKPLPVTIAKNDLLADIGLDGPVQETQIEQLQREGESERISQINQAIARQRGGWVCARCGRVGTPVTLAKSSFLTEITIWFVCFLATSFFPPTLLIAFVFTLWRFFSKYKGCASCKSDQMVSVTSPTGSSMRNR